MDTESIIVRSNLYILLQNIFIFPLYAFTNVTENEQLLSNQRC